MKDVQVVSQKPVPNSRESQIVNMPVLQLQAERNERAMNAARAAQENLQK